MRSVWAVTGLILMGMSGCIVRETREIRYVRSDGPPGCGTCEAGGQAASVVADSEPPAPLEEPEGSPPAPGYVYVNGYWDWNGDQWTWAPGQWLEPQVGWEYVPPAYYDDGDGCLYVHGHWQQSGHRRPGESIRDHRGELAGTGHRHPVRDHRGELGGASDGHHPVRDHRGELAGKHPHEPVRDHRGEHPTTPVDVDSHTWASSPFVGLPGRVRAPHHAPVRARPWSPPARASSTPSRPPVASAPPPSRSPAPPPARPTPTPASHQRPAPARPTPPPYHSPPPSHDTPPPARPTPPPASHQRPAPARPQPSHAPPPSHPAPPTHVAPPVHQAPPPARAAAGHAASHRRHH